MKVLQLSKYYDPVKGGIELVALMITKAFMADGHHTDIVAFSDKSQTRSGRFQETIYEIPQDLFFLSTPFSFRFFHEFPELVRKERFDRIYVHLPNPFMHEIVRHYRPLLRELGTKIIGVYHSDILSKGLLGKFYQNYFLKSSAAYDELLCSSPQLQKISTVLSRVPPAKVKVIPFCVDEVPVPQPELKGAGRFISIGRMVPYKGYEFLIRAFRELPFELVLIGGGPLLNSLKTIAGPNVSFLGNASEEVKIRELLRADALIVSSLTPAEAYGMTIVEAFHMGLPVIASNIPTGVTFLVREGETGRVYDVGDEKKLQSILRELIRDPNELHKLAEKGKSFYQRELGFESFTKKLLS